MTKATGTETTKPKRAYRRFQPVAKLRAHAATLKPNSPLRMEAPATIAVLRAIVNLAGDGPVDLTYLAIAKRAGGISWRQVQRIVTWAKRVGFISVRRWGGGKGQAYYVRSHLAENFLGVKPRRKHRRDMTSKSQQGRGLKPSLGTRDARSKNAPRCDAAPTPPAPRPDDAGRGVTAGTEPNSHSGRGHVPRDGAANIPAPSNSSAPRAPGRPQRSPAEIAERAALSEKMRALAHALKTAPPLPRQMRTGPPPRRR